MARTTIVQITDDIDGSTAAQTVRFALDSQTYEIDLSAEHADRLRHSLTPFLTAARRQGRKDPSSKPGQDRHGQPPAANSRAVRAWARDNGVPVSPTGRVAQAVVDQYTSAQQPPVAEPVPGEPAPAELAAAEPAAAGAADKPKRSRRKHG